MKLEQAPHLLPGVPVLLPRRFSSLFRRFAKQLHELHLQLKESCDHRRLRTRRAHRWTLRSSHQVELRVPGLTVILTGNVKITKFSSVFLNWSARAVPVDVSTPFSSRLTWQFHVSEVKYNFVVLFFFFSQTISSFRVKYLCYSVLIGRLKTGWFSLKNISERQKQRNETCSWAHGALLVQLSSAPCWSEVSQSNWHVCSCRATTGAMTRTWWPSSVLQTTATAVETRRPSWNWTTLWNILCKYEECVHIIWEAERCWG